MAWYDESRSQRRQLCSFAYTFAQIADQSIFSHITDRTTPEQLQAAQQSLRELCARLESQMDWSHYPAAYGTPHSCVRDVYTDAEFRLTNLRIMRQQAPEPAKQQLITREGIVIDLEERIHTSAEDTYLGTDDNLPDNGNTR
jgi:hypothetical protein